MGTIYEYATRSWPVVKGCSRLAGHTNSRISGFHQGLTDEHGSWTGLVKLNEAHIEDPLHWRSPETVAVAYHGDLFLAPDDVIDRVFAVMALCQQHTFLVLTKRPTQLARYFSNVSYRQEMIGILAERLSGYDRHCEPDVTPSIGVRWTLPLPSVYLGVSVTCQHDADERIPLLLQTPAAHRWISLEPMVRPVDLQGFLEEDFTGDLVDGPCNIHPGLDWVIVGAESGPGARPMDLAWAGQVLDQCRDSNIPFYLKQICRGGRAIPYEQFPEDLQVREVPWQPERINNATARSEGRPDLDRQRQADGGTLSQNTEHLLHGNGKSHL